MGFETMGLDLSPRSSLSPTFVPLRRNLLASYRHLLVLASTESAWKKTQIRKVSGGQSDNYRCSASDGDLFQERRFLRRRAIYSGDLTDEEWDSISDLFPVP